MNNTSDSNTNGKISNLQYSNMHTFHDTLQNEITMLTSKVANQSNMIDSLYLIIDFNNKKNHQLLMLLNNKINEFDISLIYYDSLYNDILSELLLIENTILTLGKSYNEIAQIKSNNNIEEIPPINDNEFKQKYVESLEAYQNGNWNISLDGFIYLLTLDKNNDLSDNCQYWIAEIYYKMKQYHDAIEEFNTLLNYYPISNKRDDALYKLGSCYMKLNNEDMADSIFIELIQNHNQSEYVKKAKYLLDN